MMDEPEDRLDERLRGIAGDIHTPPPTPKEEMWARIQAARKAGARPAGPDIIPFRPRFRWNSPVVRFAVGIAAVLLLGIGIGRLSVSRGPATGTVTPAPTLGAAPGSRPKEDVATSLVANAHFTRVESFLTEFNTRPGDSTFSAEAKTLLATTRLLLDSKRVTDVRTRQLLDDLEFVLLQIATIDPKNRPQDLDLITEDLRQNHLRTRLHNAVPLGSAIRM